MDIKDALEKCRDHWKYNAKTGTFNKEEYFEILISEGIIKNTPDSACYCCEYDDQFPPDNQCQHCPLTNYAWDTGCLHLGSKYRLWTLCKVNNVKGRKLYASMIWRACNLALADLEEPYGQVY